MSSNLKSIETGRAPLALGPYSQAIQVDNLLFLSGQIGLDPATQQLVTGGLEAELKQAFHNVENILLAAGVHLDKVIKLTIYLRDITYYDAVNELMSKYFSLPYPARAVVGVSALPKGASVEVDAIASSLDQTQYQR